MYIFDIFITSLSLESISSADKQVPSKKGSESFKKRGATKSFQFKFFKCLKFQAAYAMILRR